MIALVLSPPSFSWLSYVALALVIALVLAPQDLRVGRRTIAAVLAVAAVAVFAVILAPRCDFSWIWWGCWF